MSLDYLIEHVGVEPPVFGESHSSVTWWKCDRGPQWRAYAERKLNPSWQVSEIRLLNSLQGPTSGEIGKYHYVVETDISKAAEDEFNAWYDTEHLPGLARVPGTVSAKRFMRLSGLPRYIACYELLSPSVMESREWLAVRHTAWSSRIRPMFLNTVRELFIRHS